MGESSSEIKYLPANGSQSSSSNYEQWESSQTLTSEELLDGRQKEKCEKCGHKQGSHRQKRLFSILSVLLCIAAIVIFVLGAYIAFRSAGPCPESWVSYKGRCYYISETSETWKFSQKNCSSYGATLAAIDAPWELDFLMRLRGPSDRWIGLHREEIGKPWKWTNGSLFNNWFNIAADGLCVYLQDSANSANCDTQRHWICRK